MKKLLACGLILSTLMSCGSVCFAGRGFTILDDSDSEMEIDYPSSEDEDDYGHDDIGEILIGIQDCEETKKPRRTPGRPRGTRKETKPVKERKTERFIYLRNRAMGLLFEDGYTMKDILEMKMNHLSEDHAVLTVNGESKSLPADVVEALEEYLAERAPNTDGEMPLFTKSQKNGGMPLTLSGVRWGIYEHLGKN